MQRFFTGSADMVDKHGKSARCNRVLHAKFADQTIQKDTFQSSSAGKPFSAFLASPEFGGGSGDVLIELDSVIDTLCGNFFASFNSRLA